MTSRVKKIDTRTWKSICLAIVVALAAVGLGGARVSYAVGDCTVPGSHATIQAAINDVACTTINIGAGTFAEQITLTRNGVTLNGAGVGSTTINTSGTTNYGLDIRANNVTLSNFTVTGNPTNYAVKISGTANDSPVGSGVPAQNVTVQNVTVNNSKKTGVDLNGVNGAILTNVTVNNTVSGNGVALTDVNNATLTNITTSNNAWGGVAVYTYGRYFPGGSNAVALSNVVGSEPNPIYTEVANFGTPASPFAITNLTLPVAYTHAVRNPIHRSGGERFVFHLTSEANAILFALGLPNPSGSYANAMNSTAHNNFGDFVVGNSGGNSMSIQAAVNAASTGNVIKVGTGTYAGAISITAANLRITGVSDGADTATNTVIDIAGNTTGLTVSANGVTLEQLRVKKDGVANNGSGIVVGAVNNLTLSNVTVTGAQNGLRVSGTATVNGLTITDSHFDGNFIGWYFAKDSANASTVTNVNVSDTTFNNNAQKGIYTEKLEQAIFDGITVDSSGTDAAYGFNNGIDINLKWSAYSNIQILNSVISNSGHKGSATNPLFPAAVAFKARDDAPSYSSPAASLNGVTIFNTKISGPENALRFGEPGKSNIGPLNVGITFSELIGQNLAGNTGFGLINETQTSINAENNWWGNSSGPTNASNPTGTGSSVSNNVDFTPWIGAAVAAVESASVSDGEDVVLNSGGSPVATATYSGGGSATVTLAEYSGNPAGANDGGGILVGGSYYDIHVANSTEPAATLTLQFAAANGEILRYFDGSNWNPIISNNGTSPVASGGNVTIVFGPNSLPRLIDLTGTPIVSGSAEAIEIQFADASIVQGQQIAAAVVAKSTNLAGVEVHLTFNAAALQVSNIILGGDLASDVVGANDYDNAGGVGTGTIDFAFSQLRPRVAATGDDILVATIIFQAVNSFTGATTVDYSATAETLFSNPDGVKLGGYLTGGPSNTLDAQGDSVTVVQGATVAGTVLVQGRTTQPATVVIVQPGSGLQTTTDGGGAFSIAGLIPRGPDGVAGGSTYEAKASFAGYLTALKTGVDPNAGSNTLATITLLGGDATWDQTINIQDLALIGSNFGAVAPLSVNAAKADINGDSKVNVLDLTMAGSNFGQVGPQNWP